MWCDIWYICFSTRLYDIQHKFWYPPFITIIFSECIEVVFSGQPQWAAILHAGPALMTKCEERKTKNPNQNWNRKIPRKGPRQKVAIKIEWAPKLPCWALMGVGQLDWTWSWFCLVFALVLVLAKWMGCGKCVELF